MPSSGKAIEPASSKLKNYVLRLLRASRNEDSDQVAMFIDSLVARGLISSEALQNLVQKAAYKGTPGNKSPFDAMTGDVGRGSGVGGASGKPTVAPDYGAEAKPYGYWNEEGKDAVQKMLEEGKTIREINEVLGSSASKVTTKFGLKSNNSKGPRPKPDEDIQAIRDLKSQNLTWGQIAEKLGKSSGGSVYNLAKRYGLTGNPEWFDQEMEQ